jgi:hypothetical protein
MSRYLYVLSCISSSSCKVESDLADVFGKSSVTKMERFPFFGAESVGAIHAAKIGRDVSAATRHFAVSMKIGSFPESRPKR